MHIGRILGCGLFAVAVLVAQDATTAKADMKDAKGNSVGTVTLTQMPNGVLVSLDGKGLPPGPHAFHVHETGKCDAPDFKSAGGHFNPGGKKHGFKSAGGHHAGDMANVAVGMDGTVKAESFLMGATLKGGSAPMLSKAMVLHATADDYATDPAGNAGGRIACGVIQ